MADCEQLAGELKVLEELLKHTSTEHKRREIIDRIDQIKAEQQERGCLEREGRATFSYQSAFRDRIKEVGISREKEQRYGKSDTGSCPSLG